MQAKDIRINAQLEIGTPIDDLYAISFINAGIREIVSKYDTALKKGVATRTITDTPAYLAEYNAKMQPIIDQKKQELHVIEEQLIEDPDNETLKMNRIVKLSEIYNLETSIPSYMMNKSELKPNTWHPFKNLDLSEGDEKPNRIVHIERILNDRGERMEEYDTENDHFMVKRKGTFAIEYYKTPDGVQSENEHPDLHELYHTALPYFVGAREKTRLFGEQDPHVQRLYGQFLTKIAEVNDKLKNQNRRRRKIQGRW